MHSAHRPEPSVAYIPCSLSKQNAVVCLHRNLCLDRKGSKSFIVKMAARVGLSGQAPGKPTL